MPWHAGVGLVEAARYAATMASIVAVARVVALGLTKRLPFFLVLVLSDILGQIVAAPFAVSSNAYRLIWLVQQPVTIVLWVFASYEVILLLSEGYPSFEKTRRQIIWAAVALGIGIPAAAAVFSHPHGQPGLLPWIFFARRFEAVAVSIAMIAANLIFALAPAPARPNSVIHARIFALLTMLNAVTFYAMGSDPRQRIQFVFSLITLACFCAWSVCLSKRGDYFEPMPLMGPEEERQSLDREREAHAELKELIERAKKSE